MTEAEARALYQEMRERLPLVQERYAVSYNTKTDQHELCYTDPLNGEITPIAILLEACPYDDRWFLEHAPRTVTALCLLLKQSFETIRQLQPKPEKNYASQAHLQLQNDRRFLRYLTERHGLPANADAARARITLRHLLGIESLKELNTDTQAAARWRSLHHDFKVWTGERR